MKRKIALLLILAMTSLAAYAEGMVYDPTEYQSTVSKTTEKAATTVKNTVGSVNKSVNKAIETKTKESSSYALDSLSGQSSNFSNALYELDSAQVNIRNELLDYQAKYQEIDTQYKLIKEQRRVLAEQIKAINKKVNAIEKSKNQIRKTMT